MSNDDVITLINDHVGLRQTINGVIVVYYYPLMDDCHTTKNWLSVASKLRV